MTLRQQQQRRGATAAKMTTTSSMPCKGSDDNVDNNSDNYGSDNHGGDKKWMVTNGDKNVSDFTYFVPRLLTLSPQFYSIINSNHEIEGII
jgi:hypothetical protein